MSTTQSPSTTPQPQPAAAPPNAREFILKLLQAKPGERPLNEQEFAAIKHMVDRRQGGLTKEAYEMFKGDKEVVKAASISQVHRDHRIMNARAKEARPILLKALNAKPGEKPLSEQEFKGVAIFLDRKNGGIRRHAFQIFKDDKEITAAAQKHREAWREHANSRDPKTSKETSPSKGKAAATKDSQSKEPAAKNTPVKTSAKEAQPAAPKPGKGSKLREYLNKNDGLYVEGNRSQEMELER